MKASVFFSNQTFKADFLSLKEGHLTFFNKKLKDEASQENGQQRERESEREKKKERERESA